jgi:formate dehydrogenase subunit gamma
MGEAMTAAASEIEKSDIETQAREICAGHGDKPEALIEILHEIQAAQGYVPREAVGPIADALNLSRAEVHGVLSYYHDFRDAPAGRCVVKICRAEACQSVGADVFAAEAENKLGVKSGETAEDGSLTVETVYCLGDCALGPAVMVDGKLYGRMTADRLKTITRDALKASTS